MKKRFITKVIFWSVPVLMVYTNSLAVTKCPSSFQIQEIINEVIDKETEKTHGRLLSGYPDINEGNFIDRLSLKEVRFGKASGDTVGKVAKPTEKMSSEYYVVDADTDKATSLFFIEKPFSGVDCRYINTKNYFTIDVKLPRAAGVQGMIGRAKDSVSKTFQKKSKD